MNNTQLDIIIKAQNLASSQLQAVSEQIKTLEKNSDNANSGFGKMTMAVAAGNAVWDLAKNSIRSAGDAIVGFVKNAADVEMLRTSMDTLTGSTEAGKEMFASLYKMAAETPFETTDLAKATQTLLGFGEAQKDIWPDLKMLGDVSMGNKDKLGGLALVYAQVQSQGKLMGQDMLQMVNNGFNPLNEISRTTGKSMSVLKDEMSKGAITADMVKNAFKTATESGGLFYGGMDKGSKTLQGTWSTLQDNIGMMTRKLVGLSETGEVVKGRLFDKISESVRNLNDWMGKNQDKVDAWARDFQKVIEELVPILQTAFDLFVKVIKFLSENQWVLQAIINLFIGIKTAMFLEGAVTAFQGAMTAAGGSYSILAGAMATPLILSVAIGGALYAIEEVAKAAKIAADAVDSMYEAKVQEVQTQANAYSQLRATINNPASTSAEVARAKHAFNVISKSNVYKGFASGGFTGQGSQDEVAGIVHKGEYVVPKSQVNQSTGKPKMGGMVINNYNTFTRDSDPLAFARTLGFQLARSL